MELGEGVVLGRGNNLYRDSEMIKRKKIQATSRFLSWMIECQSLKMKNIRMGTHFRGRKGDLSLSYLTQDG